MGRAAALGPLPLLHSRWPAPSPSSTPLYTGREAPLGDTTIDPLDLFAVCGAPSTIVHLDNIVVALRRSPASVEHHHRHHAVMLTELSLEALLDREFVGLHRAERVQITEVPYDRY